ncbi:MAG: hypothetical protein KME45_00305 [Stenomitos rutilans HA7619-LM2]|nr:hypothetical protein [Stenomitos rutilans HA7619-LM2]
MIATETHRALASRSLRGGEKNVSVAASVPDAASPQFKYQRRSSVGRFRLMAYQYCGLLYCT